MARWPFCTDGKHEAVGRHGGAGRPPLDDDGVMATWLNPKSGVIHAVAEGGLKTSCGFVRLWRTQGRIDHTGRLTEEYLEEVKQEFGGPWSLCCHCRERGGEDRIQQQTGLT